MADLSVGLLTFENGAVSPTNQPKLSCGAANQLALEVSSLRLDSGRELFFRDNGQVRCFDDHHRVVFNRQALSLELHEQGDICFLTGGPPPEERLRILANGNVGIGTPTPAAKLQVTGGAIMPAVGNTAQAGIQFPSNPGGGLGDEAFIRYFVSGGETTKLLIGINNEADDTIGFHQMGAERLSISNGNVGIGTAAPTQKLQVAGNAVVNNVFLGDVGHTAVWAGFSHSNQVGTASYALLQSQDGIYTLINKKSGGGHIGFRVDNIDKVTINDNGDLTVRGALSFPNTGGGLATLSAEKYSNESSLLNNNVKLIMGSTGPFIGRVPMTYEFAIGHLFRFQRFGGGGIVFGTNFEKRFSINQDGQGYFAAGKAGYVVDHFVNRVGDTLEQGDVVVISQYGSSTYSGTNNNIPLPEVDLAAKAHDTRVCGIVAQAVSEQDLPFVESMYEALSEDQESAADNAVEDDQPYDHPLKQFAAPAGESQDRRSVQDQQMGTMVTLGAYAHCKVDADIAPIEVGDLLTTSPTKGHAQKVLDPSQAVGAIIGKALGSLGQGKGKIPVLVMLQ